MSSLGQWFFEREKASILASVKGQAPYVAKVSSIASGGRVRIVDPFTQSAELEELTVVGTLPGIGQSIMVTRLVDGERVVFGIPDRVFHSTYTNSVAIGDGAAPTWWDAVAIGDFTNAYDRAAAIGEAAEASAIYAVAIGYASDATASDAIAIGRSTLATALEAVAIGYAASANTQRAIAIGRSTAANAEGAIGIGYTSNAGRLAVAMGYQAGQGEQTGELSISIGYWARGMGQHSIAVGRQTSATATYATAVQYLAEATGIYSIALGYNTLASNTSSVAIGTNAESIAASGVAIGVNASANHTRSIALGSGATTTNLDQCRIHANELALDRSLGSGATSLILRSPNGTWKRLTISDTNVVSITNA